MSHFAPGNNRMICHLFLKGIQADVAYRTTAKMAERKQARRRKLPGEGIRMFGKKGYHLTTVPMIVAAARSSIGSFYFYFRNKGDIFAAALNEAIAEAGPDVLAQMRAAVTAFVEFLARHPDEARILLVESSGLGPRLEAVRNELIASHTKRGKRVAGRGGPVGSHGAGGGGELLGGRYVRVGVALAKTGASGARGAGGAGGGDRRIQSARNRRARTNDREIEIHAVGPERRATHPKEAAMNFLNEVRYGMRVLLKSPSFTVTAALTLAVCIAANAAIFSMADAAFRPYPFRELDRLMALSETIPQISTESLQRFGRNFFRLEKPDSGIAANGGVQKRGARR